MTIIVEFLSMPVAAKIIGNKLVTIDFNGSTVTQLINQLVDQYGEKLGEYLLDAAGNIDPVFQVMINGKIVPYNQKQDRILKNRDRFTMMLLVAGG